MFVVRDWTRNPSYTMVSNDVKDVRDIVIGRKRCGDRCHYPDCRHTTDISHALNAPTFPNGFEKVKHNGNVYFVERED